MNPYIEGFNLAGFPVLSIHRYWPNVTLLWTRGERRDRHGCHPGVITSYSIHYTKLYEEILLQAERTFLRIRPDARVGYYTGKSKDETVDILCASIQTLGKPAHLERFSADHFDYVVVDEFHHASAATYRRLLNHVRPGFLLGLTATPERTDQSDILSLCDNNLIYSCNLFNGVKAELLVPFGYYGIFDETVDYRDIRITSYNVCYTKLLRARSPGRACASRTEGRRTPGRTLRLRARPRTGSRRA